jgi:hypothetical protein
MVSRKMGRPTFSPVGLLPRRDFLRMLTWASAISAFPRLVPASDEIAFPFSEVPSSASGIVWAHVAGSSPEKYLPESTGAGCAFLDYDNDGWMDIYLVNSGRCDFFTPKVPLRNALYRNNRDGTFTDVTEKAGVVGGGYGMGVAVGDYNGDGFPDLYVTQYGRSILYRNNGDGTFADVTEKAGVAAPGWASSAVWFDYDNDGRLDLFVCRFVDFDRSKHHRCGAPKYSSPRRPKRILLPEGLLSNGELVISQQWRWDVYRRQPEGRHRREPRQELGSGSHRYQ